MRTRTRRRCQNCMNQTWPGPLTLMWLWAVSLRLRTSVSQKKWELIPARPSGVGALTEWTRETTEFLRIFRGKRMQGCGSLTQSSRRHSSKRTILILAVTLILSFSIIGSVFSQGRQPRGPQDEGASPADSFDHDQKAKMDKERRDEAFQKLKDDSQKLYEAAGELKEMIEKSNQHTLSLQILKKTEEIERLVKEVKRRARDQF
jgi:hypothetical protein